MSAIHEAVERCGVIGGWLPFGHPLPKLTLQPGNIETGEIATKARCICTSVRPLSPNGKVLGGCRVVPLGSR